jgi:hypothetical protein
MLLLKLKKAEINWTYNMHKKTQSSTKVMSVWRTCEQTAQAHCNVWVIRMWWCQLDSSGLWMIQLHYICGFCNITGSVMGRTMWSRTSCHFGNRAALVLSLVSVHAYTLWTEIMSGLMCIVIICVQTNGLQNWAVFGFSSIRKWVYEKNLWLRGPWITW